jgi:cell division protein ZapA (FtsZ GTPase activity inhibitor)
MNHHTVTILHKNYNISCDDNEIPRLQECTDFVNSLLQKIHKTSVINSENTLLIMALLTITDELMDYKNKTVPVIAPHQEQTTKEIIKIEVQQKTPDDIVKKLENLCQKMTATHDVL